MKSTSINKFCGLPPYTIACGHDATSSAFYAITHPHDREVAIIMDTLIFQHQYCQGCDMYCSPSVVRKEITDSGATPTVSKIASYCDRNNICTGSESSQNKCPKGHNNKEPLHVSIRTPYLLWTWKYKAKAKSAWTLRAIRDFSTDAKELQTTPYLLANVYGTNTKYPSCICWRMTGSNNKLPQDLKQAYYLYWNAPFTKETTPATVTDLVSYIQEYEPLDTEEFQLFDVGNIQNWYIHPKFNYFQYSNDPKILQTIPLKVRREDEAFLGLISLSEDPSYHFVSINGYDCIKRGKLKGKVGLTLIKSPA